MAGKTKYTFHVISDATGGLANLALTRVLTQLPDLNYKIEQHIFQDSLEKIEETLLEIKRKRHIVIFTMVAGEQKRVLQEYCEANLIPHIDLLGPVVRFVAERVQHSPVNEIRRLHIPDDKYLKRLEAMEYTAQHDDSRRLETLHEADIVIVGLSRVTKSPTATFLGSQGWKVANVSIARESALPRELLKVKNKIVAFTMSHKKLHQIRKRRFSGFEKQITDRGLKNIAYYDLEAVRLEVLWAEAQYKKRKYPILNVTHATVEESAAHVRKLLKLT